MIRTLFAIACLFSLHSEAIAKPAGKAAGSRLARTASLAPEMGSNAFPGFGLIGQARFYLGRNPTDLHARWCGRFLRMILQRAGYGDPGRDFDAAASYAKIGRAGPPSAGAIVVYRHHVAIITGITRPGFAMMISGNDGPAGGRAVMERERPIAGHIAIRHL